MFMIRYAFIILMRNKLRAFLTVLGIMIGIFAVISVVSVGTGVRKTMSSTFESIGRGIINVNVNFKANEPIQDRDFLDLTDYEIIRKSSNAKYVTPSIDWYSFMKPKTIGEEKDEKENIKLEAANESIINIRNLEIVYGRSLLSSDNTTKNLVCVIDNILALKYYGKENAVGEKLKFNKFYQGSNEQVEFSIVGIYRNPNEQFKGSWLKTGFQRFNQIPIIYMPILTFKSIWPWYIFKYNLKYIVQVKDDLLIEDAVDKILNAIYFKKGNSKNKYIVAKVFSNQMLERIDNTLGQMTNFIVLVALISLIVGGIGIMNIMLVSVTERTREIGIRKAIGAKNRDILFQFLIEAIILTLIGALIGLLFGYLGALGLAMLIGSDPYISIFASLISLISSVVLGVAFGLYPALKASKLNPVDALRYE